MPPCRGAISVENLALMNKRGKRMKRFFLSFLMLLTLINWLPTHAEALAPTVAITGPTVANGAFNVEITFSETVTGFEVGDIDVTNGTATLGSMSGNVYEATITPAANAVSVSVMIAANAVTVQNGVDKNSASNTLSVSIDRIAPDGVDYAAISYSEDGVYDNGYVQ